MTKARRRKTCSHHTRGGGGSPIALDHQRRCRSRCPVGDLILLSTAQLLALAMISNSNLALAFTTITTPLKKSQPAQTWHLKIRPHSLRWGQSQPPSWLSYSSSHEAPQEVSRTFRNSNPDEITGTGEECADGTEACDDDVELWEMRHRDNDDYYYLALGDTERGRLRSFQSDLRNLAEDDPQLAQDAVEIMEQMYVQGKYPETSVSPDPTCYRIVLEGWLHGGCLEEAEALLLDMDERFGDLEHAAAPVPSSSLSQSALPSLSSSSSSSSSTTTTVSQSQSSLTWTYLQVAQAWAMDDLADEVGAVRAEGLLRRLQQKQNAIYERQQKHDKQRECLSRGDDVNDEGVVSWHVVNASAGAGVIRSVSPEPSVVQLWTVVVDAWCKRAGLVPGATERAEALISEMEAAYTQRNDDRRNGSGAAAAHHPSILLTPLPNVHVYTVFLGGLARSKQRDLARQAEAVLERMRQYGVEPDMVAYTSVLNCWSKAVSRREREVAASRSTKLLAEMESRYIRHEQYHVKPSLITYATAMRAIGRSLDPQAASLAEATLERMYHLHRTGLIANLKPTTQTYNALLHALSMAPGDEDQKLRNARRAEEILRTMMKLSKKGEERDVGPDVRSWAAVLRCWAQCSWNAAENCQRILDNLNELRESGDTAVRPNFVCYTTVMGVWGNSKRKDGLERMEKILKYMEDTYEKTLEADVRPNTVSYVTVIDAFVRRNEPDAALRAQATVDRMLRLYAKGLGHVRPNRIIFNCLINAYSKSKDKDAAQNAEKIFKWMETQSRIDETVRPDGSSLCGVLNAWANQATSEGAERALQIWNRMQTISSEDRGFGLSIMMPNIVIKAIARTKDPEAVEKVEQILIRLEKNFSEGSSRLRPDVTTASSVINAAAYYAGGQEGRSRALDIAMRTFRKIIDWGQDPNNITFGTLLKAVANLVSPSDPQRETLARELFDQCCELGFVDGFVLSQVRNASPQLYRELVEEPCGLGGPTADTSVSSLLKNIPSEWSANVVD